MTTQGDHLLPLDEQWTSSAATQVRYEPDGYSVRDHWWSRKRRGEGLFIATHTKYPGLWGGGETEQAALDDMCEVIRDAVQLGLVSS